MSSSIKLWFCAAVSVLASGLLGACTDVVISIYSPLPGELLRKNSVELGISLSQYPSGMHLSCRLDAQPPVNCYALTPNTFSSLSEGQHAIAVNVVQGSATVSSASVTFRVDTIFPRLTVSSPTPSQSLPTSSPAVVFSSSGGEGGVGYRCQLDAGPLVPCTSPHSFSGVLNGPHVVKVTATDASGDNTSVTVQFAVTSTGGAQPTPSIQIAAGENFSCALLANHKVRCWGLNDQGQLGYGHKALVGDDELPWSAGDVSVGGDVVQIAAGSRHTCVLLSNQKVRCWGANNVGQLGYGHTNDIGDDELPASAGDVSVGGPVLQISAGFLHTCALLSNRSVRCWGWASENRLGEETSNIGDDELPSSGRLVRLGGDAVQVSAGSDHSCALLTTGNVRCWGYGDLGYGQIGDVAIPANFGDIDVGGKVSQIAIGSKTTCALLATGSVRCWGPYVLGYGRNWVGPGKPPSLAGDMALGGSAIQIAGMRTRYEYGHMCAILTGGRLRCWGSNESGQLGYANTAVIGDDELPESAGDVDVGGAVIGVDGGPSHTCALLSGGGVRCWGWVSFGALGYATPNNTIGDNETPASVGEIAVGF